MFSEIIPLSSFPLCSLVFLTNKRALSEQPQESYQLPVVLQLPSIPVNKQIIQFYSEYYTTITMHFMPHSTQNLGDSKCQV